MVTWASKLFIYVDNKRCLMLVTKSTPYATKKPMVLCMSVKVCPGSDNMDMNSVALLMAASLLSKWPAWNTHLMHTPARVIELEHKTLDRRKPLTT